MRAEPLPPSLAFGEPGSADYNTILNLEERGSAMNDTEVWNNFEQLSMLDYFRASFDDFPPELEPRAVRALIGG